MSSGDGNRAWHAWTANFSADQCLLRALSEESARERAALTSASLADLRRFVEAGLTLRSAWPRPWNNRLEQQIGRRLYLTHAANLSASSGLASLASSAMGRGRQQVPEWPALLDSALQRIQVHDQKLLVVPGTTVYDDAMAFARRANLDCLDTHVERLKRNASASVWLQRWLTVSPAELRGKLLISAQLNEPTAESSDRLPLQDRLAVLLSDVVLAMHVRSGGTIDQLLQERLAAPEYPLGTTYCAVKPTGSLQAIKTQTPLELMNRGAIGWYVLQRRPPLGQHPFLACHQPPPALLQLTACNGACRRTHRETDVWLTHCTRGTFGAAPKETAAQFRDRLWLTGAQQPSPPLRILSTILAERLLRASSQLYRAGRACISFTAVPLAELLRRRSYRPHLGRWDWEPYGLVIRRDALERLGCRPVIYGSEQVYQGLPDEEKPYFQPNSTGNDWSLEREWRLVSDLDLSNLPFGSWFAFTRSRREAQQLSRCAPCPVCWIGEQEQPSRR